MNLFCDHPNFDHMTLRDLGLNYYNPEQQTLAPVGFQRNAVWKELKVQDLWDLLLSGFPIGAILLARHDVTKNLGFRPPQISRSSPSPDVVMGQDSVEYIIVDGQQRANAITLGFMPFSTDELDVRLWFDLAEPADRNKCPYEFYLCSRENPFGVSGGNPLSYAEKRAALAAIDKPWADDLELTLAETYPYKAKMPVPFYEFWRVFEPLTGEERAALQWKDVCEKVFRVIFETDAVSETVQGALKTKFDQSKFQPRKNLAQLFESLARAVYAPESSDKSVYQVPVILITEPDPLRLGKLFERVNVNGEVPPPADLFYSALKLRNPLVNDYVASVDRDSELKGMFKPTDLVLTALRMVDSDVTELQLSQFDKHYDRNKDQLLSLLVKDGDQGRSLFHRCLIFAYHALLDQGNGDFGLPWRLLRYMRGRVWHSTAYWVCKHYDEVEAKGGVNQQSWLEMVRYAMADYFRYFLLPQNRRIPNQYTNQKHFLTIPFEEINSCSGSTFPANQIMKRLQTVAANADWKIYIPKPQEYYEMIRPEANPDFPNYTELVNEDGLLYYAQRELLGIKHDIHYDVDHIIPSAWMSFRRGPLPSDFWRVENVDGDRRYRVMDTWGNKRFWPSQLNRSYRDKPPKEKYIHGQCEDQVSESTYQEYGMNSVDDVLRLSFIDQSKAELWKQVEIGTDNHYWTTERFRRFKELVDMRRCRMYQYLYDLLDWGAWKDLKNAED